MHVQGLARLAAVAMCALLSACASYSVKKVDATQPIQAQKEIPEEQLLNVGITEFDPGIPEGEDAQEDVRVFPEVRKAEARYIPFTLKRTLQGTGQWGAVRVLPEPTESAELLVSGKIEHSDGERLTLKIHAEDASGRVWLDKRYTQTASKYAYDKRRGTDAGSDAFQDLYDTVANDLLAARKELSAEKLRKVRQISELRFADELAPYAFDGYLKKNDDGRYKIKRLPAQGDPVLARVDKVRQREYLFVDTLDQHYEQFHRDMQAPYGEWRQSSYQEAKALHELKGSAIKRMALGAASVLGGLFLAASGNGPASSAAGQAAVLGGALVFKSGLDKNSQSRIHAEALKELGNSFKAEVEPRVVKLKNRTVTLSGSVEQQFKEWRGLLKEIYASETGLGADVPELPRSADDTQADDASGSDTNATGSDTDK